MQLKLELIDDLNPEYANSKDVFTVLNQINWHLNKVRENKDKMSLEKFYSLQEIEESLDEIYPYYMEV